MTSAEDVFASIRAALTAAGVNVADGPALRLPVDSDGEVKAAAVLWPAAGLNDYERASGTRSGRVDRLTVTCVGATNLAALGVADAVEAAIGGMRVSAKGGTLRQVAASVPTSEPNSAPRRVSLGVEYSIVTKG